jgi:hypothetical protein
MRSPKIESAVSVAQEERKDQPKPRESAIADLADIKFIYCTKSSSVPGRNRAFGNVFRRSMAS